MTDPTTDEAHAARMIRQCATVAELQGYRDEATRRGITAHEIRLIEQHRNTLNKRK